MEEEFQDWETVAAVIEGQLVSVEDSNDVSQLPAVEQKKAEVKAQ